MEIQQFIDKYGLNADFNSFMENTNAFVEEMELGLNGKPSSLMMIPAYVSLDHPPQRYDGSVVVIDAGGTNLRVAVVRFSADNAPIIEESYNHSMLGLRAEITIEGFFEGLAEFLRPVAAKSGHIGFCFSFPCEIMPDLDGRVLFFDKEIKIKDSEGAILGEGLRRALKKKGLPHDHRVVVINDTVATLLGGRADSQNRLYDSYIGYILGTGTNTCYNERNINITKNPVLCSREGSSLINMESGGYDRFPRSAVDEGFDSKLESPGTQLLEKMISGAYQGKLLLAYVDAAVREGYLQQKGKKGDGPGSLEAREVDEFLAYPHGKNKLAESFPGAVDKVALYHLIDAFFERAAALTSVNLTGVMQKTGAGKSPLAPVCITAEGSTFYKSRMLHEKVSHYMTEYAKKRLGMYFELKRVENVTLLGAAYAALL